MNFKSRTFQKEILRKIKSRNKKHTKSKILINNLQLLFTSVKSYTLYEFFIISDAIYNNINLLLAKNTYKNLLYLAALTTITDQMFPK